jgi:general secretion pathway protein D
LLGDIPGLGWLFRYDSRKRAKTNLLVFLRPIVIRDAGNAWDVTANRYDYIRSTSGNAQFPHMPPLPDYRMPDMQDMPPRPGTPGAPTPPRSPASLTPGLAEIFGSDRITPPPRAPASLSRPQPDLPGIDPPVTPGVGAPAAPAASRAAPAPAPAPAPAARPGSSAPQRFTAPAGEN